MAARQEEIQEVEGIGPERAGAIADWFAEDENRVLVEELRALGLRLEAGAEDRPVEGPLTGSTYVITGTLERLSREEATAALEALGAKVAGSVSSKTTGLIVGEEPGGSKVKGAQKHGTPILAEDALVSLIGGDAAVPKGERRQTLAPPPRRR
jgi:DNA ligase (NAD+)